MATTEEFKNGGSTSYSFSIEYIKASDIKVKIDGVAQTYTTNASPSSGQYKVVSTTVTLGAAASGGTGNVHIYRETDLDTAAATFVSGSSIRAADLNAIHDLTRLASQEQNQIVTTADIRDSAVTTAKINAGAVTTAKIAADSITNAKIADNSIDSEHYVDGSIDTAHLADNSVTSAKLVAGTVATSDLADLGVTTAKIANDAITADKIADNVITASHIASEAISGSEIATNSITSTELADNSVTSSHIVNNSIVDADVNSGAAIAHTKLAGAAGGKVLLGNGSNVVTATTVSGDVTINSSGVTAITPGSIVTGDIAADNITSALIADDQINSEHYVDASIKDNHIQDGNITNSKIADDAVTNAKIADGTLDGRYYTETELNAGQLDNRYYTEAEADARFYNLASTEEIQSGETWVAADNKVATTSAIDARIIDLVDEVGGFVPIANETSFPNANPDVNNGAGTLVSIKALSSNLTSNGSGVATIANGTVGNSTVTITGLANSTTYASTFGMIVETTTTLNTYTFHRQVPKATEVTTVSGSISNVNTVAGAISNVNAVAGNATNINTVAGSNSNVTSVAGSISNVNSVASNLNTVNDFAARYRTGANNPTSSLDVGDLFFNTSANELKVYNGSSWQGGVTASGNFASTTGNTFTGDNLYNDGVKGKFGTGSDLQINHSGSHAFIQNSTGSLIFESGTTVLRSGSQENYLVGTLNGSVDLYFDGVKKFESTSAGVTVTGTGYVSGGWRPSSNGGASLGSSSYRWYDLNISNDIDISDNGKVILGDGDDLHIYHDGSNSYVSQVTAGQNLFLKGDAVQIRSASNEQIIETLANGAVKLYYDNSKKFETNSSGVAITGSGTFDAAGSNYLRIGSTDASGATLTLDGDSNGDGSGADYCMIKHDSDGDLKIIADNPANAANTIFYSNASTERLRITSDGKIRVPDSGKLQFGAGPDLEIYSDGTNSYIQCPDTGNNLTIESDQHLYLKTGDGDMSFKGISGGSAEIYHHNVKKLETVSGGINVVGYVNVQSGGHVYLEDAAKLMLGASSDLQIYHDTNSLIKNGSGSGSLYVRSDNNIFLQDAGGNETFAKFIDNGAVELYYDGTRKAYTNSGGFALDSHLIMGDSDIIKLGNGADLQIYHSGSHSYIKDIGTGGLNFCASALYVTNAADSELMIAATENAGVNLYYDHVQKINTNASGVDIGLSSNACHLMLFDGGEARFGTGQDLKLWHDGSNSYIKNSTNALTALTGGFYINNVANSESMAAFNANSHCSLYYDNSNKLSTTSTGIAVTGNVVPSGYISMVDNAKLYIGTSNDMQIFHDSSGYNYVYGSTPVYVQSNTVKLQSQGGENYLTGNVNAHTSLFYDNSQKFYTQSNKCVVAGHLYPEANYSYNLGENNYQWHTVFSKNTAKAYGNFNQTNHGARRNFNISSYTDYGTGQTRVTFTTALAADYIVTTGGSRDLPESSRCYPTNIDNINTGYFELTNHNDGSSNVDWALMMFTVFGS